VTAFYDIDTPVTLAKLARKDYEYITPELISQYDLYLSFTGGPTLRRIEREFGSSRARALYCSVDPELYYPERRKFRWDLGYLGTYSQDRQPPLEKLMLRAARQAKHAKFVVAGPMYPDEIDWPANVKRIPHLEPGKHRAFYNAQRFTLNITRTDMIRAGWSPSVRIFEAAACGVPIISDYWEGLGDLLEIGKEILVSRGPQETLRWLFDLTEPERRAIGRSARARVLSAHTAAHRALELEQYLVEAGAARSEALTPRPSSNLSADRPSRARVSRKRTLVAES
jgi:spore maturation protein CgeB